MRTTEWAVTEGREESLFYNYSKARDCYLSAVKRNKVLRKSRSFFQRLKARMVVFAPLN